MVKRKTTQKTDDISNWAVVLMLVAVIVVSTLSIVLFMDAADGAIVTESASIASVGLEVSNPNAEPSNDSSVIIDNSGGAGELSLEVQG
jgi:hypothetical protein